MIRIPTIRATMERHSLVKRRVSAVCRIRLSGVRPASS